MQRGARLDAPATLHHVIIRGIEKGYIVRELVSVVKDAYPDVACRGIVRKCCVVGDKG